MDLEAGNQSFTRRARAFARTSKQSLSPYVWSAMRWYVPDRRFVLFCPPRSGSSLLLSLLNSHPAIAVDGHLFGRYHLLPERYLRGMAARRGARGAAAYGFKLHDSQLRFQLSPVGTNGAYLAHLVHDGWLLIYLTRRDVLAEALSLIHATHHSRFHNFEGDAGVFEPMEVDVAELLACLHTLDDTGRWAAEVVSGLPHIPLVYEDDLCGADDRRAAVRRILNALELPYVEPQTTRRAVAPRDPFERVVNRAEIEASLRLTRFAGLADRTPAHL